jgi:1,4-alpha-glucan branching enzyme
MSPRNPPSPLAAASRFSQADVFWFNEGTHRGLAGKLGGRLGARPEDGASFAVWAPSATAVSVIGDFNDWDRQGHLLEPVGSSGIWEGSVPTARRGDVYKYAVTARHGERLEKADPVALMAETPPKTGSVLWDLDYDWRDAEWMATRGERVSLASPISIYEVHLGSWWRDPSDWARLPGYRELAPRLIDHVRGHGFTHVELLPLMEHPFYGSWGYQVTGFFAPTSRYGTPQDLMWLIDELHGAGIGVILDWVPSHFATDAFALGRFDGTHLYEHADPQRGIHPDWNSYVFNYGRHEVRSFLASSAEHWLSAYHADALRVDGVASMLYLDYSRKAGEWTPNPQGGREDLDAVAFLQQLNIGIYEDHPDVQVIAEESTAWPGVSRPVFAGGLGFGLKWDMGWMHDTLSYMEKDPIHRRYHHGELTFRALYAFDENFVLPLSHDEVVHGKGSMLEKMPGDLWQKLANLRLLYGYQFAQPGKKMLFMGAEFGAWREWDHETGLDWGLYGDPGHAGMARWVGDLNRVYRDTPALHQRDSEPSGFEWVAEDAGASMVAFLRRGEGPPVLVVCNFTPVPRHNIQIGVPDGERWVELLNSDATIYGGSGQGNLGAVSAQPVPWHGRPSLVTITVPPLGCLFLTPE